MWYHISSIVLYGATLIVASVEMGYSVQFYNETCTEIFETQYCWPFFVVAWALAITASALSLLRDMVLQIRHRRLRRQVQPQPAGTMRTALIVIGSAGLVAVLWLVTIVVGWVQPQLPEEAQLPSWDWFGQSVDSGDWYSDESSQLPATGMFQWSVDYSNAVNAYQQSSYSNLWPLPSWVTDPAHAGLAAVVLCTMSLYVDLPLPLFIPCSAPPSMYSEW